LGKLREFKGLEENLAIKNLSIQSQVDRLFGRPVWLIIGDRDERVSTDATIALARSFS